MVSWSRVGLLLVLVFSLGSSASAAPQAPFQDELANLRSPNAKTRVKAAKALGRSQRPEAISPLIDVVRDPEPEVRKAVVAALRQFRALEVVDGLLVALEDEDKTIRAQALEGVLELHIGIERRRPVLGVFSGEPDPDEVEPVLQPELRVVRAVEARLRDEDASIRRRAAYGLGLMRADAAVESLVRALPDLVLEVRTEVVDALGLIGGEQAGQALVRALADSSSETRNRAMAALGRMAYRPAAGALLTIYEAGQGKSAGDRALAALAQMGAPEARGVFYQMMTNPSPSRRRWAVEGLARLDESSLVPGLTKDFLREPDAQVQLAYCYALSRLGRPEYVDRLALSLAKPELREQSFAYLVQLGSPFLTEMTPYLSDPVAEVRRNMVSVLARVGDPAAIPYLEPLLADPDAEVADRANRAIARLQKVQGEGGTK